MLEPEALEDFAPRGQRLVEQRAAIQPQQVEDDENDRHVAPQFAVDLLAAEPALQLEESKHLSVAMREHLAVEKNVVADPWGRLDRLRKGRRRLFQVTREQLDAWALPVQLAPHAVVFLLRPYSAGPHASESLVRGLDRACEHEPDGLKRGDAADLDLAALQAHRGLATVPGDPAHALDLRDGDAESLSDR